MKPYVCALAVTLFTASVLPMSAQVVPQITCDATAEPLQIRSEGLSERLGEIVLTCTGPSTGTVSAAITLSLSHSISNKLSTDSTVLEASVVAQTATGTRTLVTSGLLVSRTVVVFGTFTFAMPASGRTSFVISGLRVAADANSERPVTALIGTNGQTSIGVRNNPVTPGVPRRGLYTSGTSARIVCTGSVLPEEISFGTLVNAGVRFATTRVTEGSPGAFEARPNPVTQGTRILIRYAGFPSQARLFLPDFIAGSTASDPTSAGDFGTPASAGSYTGNGAGGMLLLGRVPGADANGAGDLARQPPGVYLNSVSEVPLRNGEGSVTYEVIDSNAQAFESAQIPTFVALPRNSGQDGTVATAQITFGPLSTVAEASSTAPIPRFRDVVPPADCTLLRDCTAGYFPRLVVEAPSLEFDTSASPGFYQKLLRVVNDNQGLMNWTAAIQYKSGSGWLKVSPEAGVSTSYLYLTAFPEKLAPGSYEAILTVDAGLAGTRVLPVRITITGQTPPPAGTSPQIRLVSGYLSEQATTLVPGSLASIRGTRLVGQDVKVSFDGFPAQVVAAGASGDEQKLDVVVPLSLGIQTRAVMQVVVNGIASLSQPVNLTSTAPVIFPNGLLNQDGAANSNANPEAPGRLFIVFATGLPAEGLGFISAKIHDREITQPQFAGPAPGLPGIQQVNFFIPEDLPSMQSEVLVCGTPANSRDTRVCSKPYTIQLRRTVE